MAFQVICTRLCAVSKSFDQLFGELTRIAARRPEGSGTVKKLDEGTHSIGKKVVEEASEVWLAAEFQTKEETAEEISQLLYWCQVMMINQGLSLEDIYRYL